MLDFISKRNVLKLLAQRIKSTRFDARFCIKMSGYNSLGNQFPENLDVSEIACVKN